MLIFLHYSMDHHSVERRDKIVFAKNFLLASFHKKKLKLLLQSAVQENHL